jgi:hypothetical protein
MQIETLNLILIGLLVLALILQNQVLDKYKKEKKYYQDKVNEIYKPNNVNNVNNVDLEKNPNQELNDRLAHHIEVNRILKDILLGKLVIKIKNKYRYSFKTNSGERFLSRITEIRNNKETRVFVEGEPYYETIDKNYIKLDNIKELKDMDIVQQHIHLINSIKPL